MANTLLSPTIITREALRVLHQSTIFIKKIDRQYDNRFANSGASPSGKIGPTLQIRLPNRFTVRTGATLQVQDIAEEQVALTVSTIKGVDFTFPTSDLTLTIDDFSGRYLRPAMARLAADIEADALSMANDVGNFVNDNGVALSALSYLKGGQLLDESLCPDDGKRTALLCPTHSTKIVDALKGLYNPQVNISDNFVNGEIARRTLGFDYMKTTLLTNHTTGTAVEGDTVYNVNGATESGSSITVNAGSTTFLKGDVVTFQGANAVHPETKADLGYLKTFAITANSGTSATSLSISPSLVATGPKQNVSGYPTNGGAVSKLGAGNGETYVQSLLFHPEAFTFVSADLEDVSKYGAWGARENFDGISMRIARQYDIVNDKVPCRIDVLYGYKTIRPQLACRVHADG